MIWRFEARSTFISMAIKLQNRPNQVIQSRIMRFRRLWLAAVLSYTLISCSPKPPVLSASSMMQSIDAAFEQAAAKIVDTKIKTGNIVSKDGKTTPVTEGGRVDLVRQLTDEMGGDFSATVREQLPSADQEAFTEFLHSRGEQGDAFVAKYQSLLLKVRDGSIQKGYEHYEVTP